jgi:hypothetical protein
MAELSRLALPAKSIRCLSSTFNSTEAEARVACVVCFCSSGRPIGTKLRRSNASATHDSMVDKQNHDRADDRHKHAVDIEPGDPFSPKLGK